MVDPTQHDMVSRRSELSLGFLSHFGILRCSAFRPFYCFSQKDQNSSKDKKSPNIAKTGKLWPRARLARAGLRIKWPPPPPREPCENPHHLPRRPFWAGPGGARGAPSFFWDFEKVLTFKINGYKKMFTELKKVLESNNVHHFKRMIFFLNYTEHFLILINKFVWTFFHNDEYFLCLWTHIEFN